MERSPYSHASFQVMSSHPSPLTAIQQGKGATHCHDGTMEIIIENPTRGGDKDHNGALPFSAKVQHNKEFLTLLNT